MPERILVTGANGFIGNQVCGQLASRGCYVTAAVRSHGSWALPETPHTQVIAVGDIDSATRWEPALAQCKAVIHLAARAHVLDDRAADPLMAFRKTNVDGTLQLARSALAAGVERFVFVSSIGVNGASGDRPFRESDIPAPSEPYAVSKLEAENALKDLCTGTAMKLVIVRPPLVYGPECPGNFQRLLKLVASGLPLPFGRIKNQRSLISVWNLADFLITCALAAEAAGKTFLPSDTEDISLPDLLRRLAEGMGKPARLLPVPPRLVFAAARVFRLTSAMEKLCGSLTVDSHHAASVLGWKPPMSLDRGLRVTSEWYASRKGQK